jgi:hypothetical protein
MRNHSLPGVLCGTCFTLAAALACACVPLQLNAAEYYVSQAGDDAKDGSQAAPFKTILHAVKAAGAGDTVHLVPGDQPWRESVALNTHPTWYHPGGEAGKPLTIDGHGSWITGADPCPVEGWKKEPDGVWTHRGLEYSAFLVIDGQLQSQLGDADVAEPNEVVYVGGSRPVWYCVGSKKGQPIPAIEIGQPDGASFRLESKDWEHAGRPGFLRYKGTTPKPDDIKNPAWVKIDGKDSTLVRARERLAPGKFIIADKTLFLRPSEGKTPAEMQIQAIVRGNGVYMGGNTSHVVIRNFNVRHVHNDGYNIHGGCKDIAFFNCNAEDCGDEGFSAHSDSETLLDGAVFLRCDNGINNVNRAVSVTRNVLIADCRNQGFEGQQESRATVENLILIDNKNQLSCANVTGKNILIANIDKDTMFSIGAGGSLEKVTVVGGKRDYGMVRVGPGKKLTLMDCRFEKAGDLHIRDTEPSHLTIGNSVFHPDTTLSWGAGQPFKNIKLAEAIKDKSLPFSGAGISEKPLLEALTRGERPAVIPKDSGCTAELIERYLEFMDKNK